MRGAFKGILRASWPRTDFLRCSFSSSNSLLSPSVFLRILERGNMVYFLPFSLILAEEDALFPAGSAFFTGEADDGLSSDF